MWQIFSRRRPLCWRVVLRLRLLSPLWSKSPVESSEETEKMNILAWITRHPFYSTLIYYIAAFTLMGIVFVVRGTWNTRPWILDATGPAKYMILQRFGTSSWNIAILAGYFGNQTMKNQVDYSWNTSRLWIPPFPIMLSEESIWGMGDTFKRKTLTSLLTWSATKYDMWGNCMSMSSRVVHAATLIIRSFTTRTILTLTIADGKQHSHIVLS